MNYLALPAPRIAGLLPAWTAPPAPVALLLTPAEESLLNMALRPRDTAPDGYFPVSKVNKELADNLVMAGLFEKHPSKRKIWYRLTDQGANRACFTISKEPPAPDQVRSAKAWREYNFAVLEGDMNAQGYALLPEPDRGIHLGEVTFFSIFSSKKRLFRCRLSSAQWYEVHHWFRATVPGIPSEALMLAQAELNPIP